MTTNEWVALNPKAKTQKTREQIVEHFTDYEKAQEWLFKGSNLDKGYKVRFVPCFFNPNTQAWELDKTHPTIQDVLAHFEKNATKKK